MDPAPYCMNNAAAGGDAASTYQKKVHKLSSTSIYSKEMDKNCWEESVVNSKESEVEWTQP